MNGWEIFLLAAALYFAAAARDEQIMALALLLAGLFLAYRLIFWPRRVK